MFHGPVIWPFILKVIWCMNILIWGYDSVWLDVWPQNKCRSLWPIFHCPVILLYILKTIWYMNTNFGIMGQYDSTFDLKINVSLCQWFCLTSPTLWCMSVIFSDNEIVWPKLWPQSKYKSTWPIFHGLVILFNLFKIIWWMNIIVGMSHRLTLSSICRSVTYILWASDFASYLEDYLMRNVVLGIMDQCHSKIDLVKYMWVSDLYFMVHWFCLISLS